MILKAQLVELALKKKVSQDRSEILYILALKRIICESIVLFYFSLRIF